METAAAHPHPQDGFAGMTVAGRTYSEKADAGEAILAVCKNAKFVEGYPLGSYRGFRMELYFDSSLKEFTIALKGNMTHRVSIGKDARGNLLRLDNALKTISARKEAAENRLSTLEQQREAAQAEIGKPFPQEEELAEKSARLAELDAALSMDEGESAVQEAEEIDNGEYSYIMEDSTPTSILKEDSMYYMYSRPGEDPIPKEKGYSIFLDNERDQIHLAFEGYNRNIYDGNGNETYLEDLRERTEQRLSEIKEIPESLQGINAEGLLSTLSVPKGWEYEDAARFFTDHIRDGEGVVLIDGAAVVFDPSLIHQRTPFADLQLRVSAINDILNDLGRMGRSRGEEIQRSIGESWERSEELAPETTLPPKQYDEPELGLMGTAEELFIQARNGYVSSPAALARIEEILKSPEENEREQALYVGFIRAAAENDSTLTYNLGQMRREVYDLGRSIGKNQWNGYDLTMTTDEKGDLVHFTLCGKNGGGKMMEGTASYLREPFYELRRADFEEVIQSILTREMREIETEPEVNTEPEPEIASHEDAWQMKEEAPLGMNQLAIDGVVYEIRDEWMDHETNIFSVLYDPLQPEGEYRLMVNGRLEEKLSYDILPVRSKASEDYQNEIASRVLDQLEAGGMDPGIYPENTPERQEAVIRRIQAIEAEQAVREGDSLDNSTMENSLFYDMTGSDMDSELGRLKEIRDTGRALFPEDITELCVLSREVDEYGDVIYTFSCLVKGIPDTITYNPHPDNEYDWISLRDGNLSQRLDDVGVWEIGQTLEQESILYQWREQIQSAGTIEELFDLSDNFHQDTISGSAVYKELNQQISNEFSKKRDELLAEAAASPEVAIVTREDFEEFMKRADEAERWDDIEPEKWESACEYVELNYHDYNDPDRLWRDLTEALEKMEEVKPEKTAPPKTPERGPRM